MMMIGTTTSMFRLAAAAKGSRTHATATASKTFFFSPSYYCRSLSTTTITPPPTTTTTKSSTGKKPIRWGILGAGAISTDFVKAVDYTPGAKVSAIAARSMNRANEFANSYSIPNSFGDYEALIASEDVDVVYIGTIADTHYDLAKLAIEKYKKPTVVEKPLSTSYQQAKELITLAKQHKVFFLEGMWTRFFPAMKQVRQLVASGAIGRPVVVTGDFGWSTNGCDDNHRIWYPTSGGMIYDIAMYCAQLGLAVFDGDSIYRTSAMGVTKQMAQIPQQQQQQQSSSSAAAVDHTALVNCQFDNNRKGFLQFYVTGEANTEERAVIQGTEGRIIIEAHHVPSVIVLHKENGRTESTKTNSGEGGPQVFQNPFPDDSFTTWNHPSSIGFTYQIEAVGKALRNGDLECPEFTWRESLEVAKMLEDIRGQVISSDEDVSSNLAIDQESDIDEAA